MDIYEGQVTALLGHNGAGKTTLIAMITGMVPPSGGSALVYGMEITNQNQMQKIRRIIGMYLIKTILLPSKLFDLSFAVEFQKSGIGRQPLAFSFTSGLTKIAFAQV